MGNGEGNEGRAFGYSGWYAPAVNLHRTAFNSRNFEYYSEDPLLSGKMAAALINSVQQKGVMTYVKHFALNERETNARSQLFTFCSEQAMRELYLKPFELAIKEGGALGVMSSFNYVGTDWAGGSKALLIDLLKNEWGFEGAVVTDACVYPYMDVVQMINNGDALCLDSFAALLGTSGKLKRLYFTAKANPAFVHSLQRAAKDILFAVSHTL